MSFLSAVNRSYKKEGTKKALMILAAVLACFLFAGQVSAQTGVVINEVAWMGTASSSSEEWLEFFNSGTTTVDISDWSVYGADTGECLNISDADGTSTVEIPPGDHLVYGNDEGVAGVDIWDATIGLNNSAPGELKIFSEPDCSSSSRPVDSVENEEEWLAGNNKTGQTMARDKEDNWYNSSESGGSPGESNSVAGTSSQDDTKEKEEEGSSSSGSEDVSVSSGHSSSGGSNTASQKKEELQEEGFLVINEIFPNPERGDRQWEFIEFYNPGEEELDLAGWRIRDQKGKTFEFGRYKSLNNLPSTLGAEEFLVLPRTSSGIVLNNNGDSVELLSPQGDMEQKVSYDRAPAGFSYSGPEHLDTGNISTSTEIFLRRALNPSDWAWSKEVTPGDFNQIERINLPPRVDFSFPLEVRVGEPALFDSSDTVDPNGDPLDLYWDFGDGVEVDTAMPFHTFLEPGEYSVTLRAEDGQTDSKKTRSVTVEPEHGPETREKEVDPQKDESSTPTFSEKNIPSSAKKGSSKEDQNIPSTSRQASTSSNSVPFFSLKNLRVLPEGESVLTEGKVAVKPGVLGSQYFYIVGSPGVQVYNYHKDFPDLTRGDRVEVKGEISVSRGEKRINTSRAEDIRILSRQDPPLPQDSGCREIPEKVGGLVSVQGEITEVESNKFYLDDNKAETLVYTQEGIDIDNISEGREAEIVGLVNRYNSQVRILPRDEGDIDIISSTSSQDTNSGEVRGASSRSKTGTSGKLVLDSKNGPSDPFPYWSEVILGGIIVLLAAFIGVQKLRS